MENRQFENLMKSEINKVQRYASARDGQKTIVSAWWTEKKDDFTGFVTVGCEILTADCSERLDNVYISVCVWDRRRSFVNEGMEKYTGFLCSQEDTAAAEEKKEEEPHMMTASEYHAMFEEDRKAARETVNEWRDAVQALTNQQTVDNLDNETPAHTVAEFVARVGEEMARFVIASLVNQCAWDGRIDSEVKEWAQSVDGSLSEEAANDARIYTTMHKAHLNQVAEAMAKYQPTTAEEAQETTESATEATEEETTAAEPAEAETETETEAEEYARFRNAVLDALSGDDGDIQTEPEAVEVVTRKSWWTTNSVRECCIRNELYTCGDNDEYMSMLETVQNTEPTDNNLLAVARDICEHSANQTITNIMFLLNREAVFTTFLINGSCEA